LNLRHALFPRQLRRKLRADLVTVLDAEQPSPTALKYWPADHRSPDMLIASSPDDAGRCPLGMPIPPQALWIGYGRTPEEYVESGREHVERMRDILRGSGFELPAAPRILDLGCGSGRMTRWLIQEANQGEVWGCDIDASHIHWAQRNLRPPFRFFTSTTLPTLPFPDGHFDLVYAGSVFTHVGDLAQGWLLEVRRILRPGGRAYLTFHDRHTETLMKTPAYSWVGASQELARYGGLPHDLGMLVLDRWPERGQTTVYYDHDWLRESLAPMFKVVEIVEEAYGYQSAVVAEAV